MDQDRDAIAALDDEASEVIGRCLDAWAHGPFIEDWEFDTVTGLTRDEVSAIAAAWPRIEGPNVNQAVLASLGSLLGYPHGRSLTGHVGYDEETIAAARESWRSARPAD